MELETETVVPEHLQDTLIFSIPAEMGFEDVRLAAAPGGSVLLDWCAVDRICALSDVDAQILRRRPFVLIFMLNAWLVLLTRRGLVEDTDVLRWRALLDKMFEEAAAEMGPIDLDALPAHAAGVRLVRPVALH